MPESALRDFSEGAGVCKHTIGEERARVYDPTRQVRGERRVRDMAGTNGIVKSTLVPIAGIDKVAML